MRANNAGDGCSAVELHERTTHNKQISADCFATYTKSEATFMSSNQVTERKLNDDELAEFDHYFREGLKVLEISENSPPEDIVLAVDGFVDEWQESEPDDTDDSSPEEDNVGMALALGIVWGNQIVRKFGWSWVFVTTGQTERYAVVSPDRSLVIYPAYFLKKCLDDPAVDCTVMLAFNMQQDDKLAKEVPGTYADVMRSVVRIVPKR